MFSAFPSVSSWLLFGLQKGNLLTQQNTCLGKFLHSLLALSSFQVIHVTEIILLFSVPLSLIIGFSTYVSTCTLVHDGK